MEYTPTLVGVFFKIRQDGGILDVNSSIFLQDTTGWTKVDDGHNDRYAHAQSNYLPGPIQDKHFILNYRYVPGGDPPFEERTEEEKAADLAAQPLPPLSEMNLLKAQVQALTERGEFLEDVIAELAMMLL